MPLLQIHAPFAGWCAPLDEVPDPVFAGRLLGDGVAVDPVAGVATAPCDGEIIALAAGHHAVSLRTIHGIDVLIHIGIDTVGLAGRGFDPCVQPGSRVSTGDPLIRFDMDFVARYAKSLLTPIIVTSIEGVRILRRHAGGSVTSGAHLFELELGDVLAVPAPARDAAPVVAEQAQVTETLTIRLRHGLHARPAALLSQRVRALSATVTVSARGRTADARSVVAIIALGVGHGEQITIEARGAEAALATAAIAAGLEESLRAEAAAPHVTATRRKTADEAFDAAPAQGLARGSVAVQGFAVGQAVRLARAEIAVAEAGVGAPFENRALDAARAAVTAQLRRVPSDRAGTQSAIAAAHEEFLDDPSIVEAARAEISAGASAGQAWRTAIRRSIAVFEQLEDSHLRERADDLRDLELQVLRALSGAAPALQAQLPERAVILSEDLLPSELTCLDPARLAAICLARGGATSHVAILAATLDVPMLIGLGPIVHTIVDGAELIVDAQQGVLQMNGSAAQLHEARARVAKDRRQRTAARAAAQPDCVTRDGERIRIYANVGSQADALAAVAQGAEGCGLLRTEFLFIDRDTAPDEEEQLRAYASIAAALAGRPLVLRLMDVGGDKPLRYLPLPHEDNPALGLRGVRTSLAYPELLRTQLRAALRVEPAGVLELLIPMVTDREEVRVVRALIAELCRDLGRGTEIRLGIMIETPAAAVSAARLLRDVDFVSIGSNDLTQYALAMDRGHAELAARADALHPGVLRLIAATARAGGETGKLVAVCGAVAADRAAVPVLIGLGVRELSVVPAAVPQIKAQVRALTLETCRDLAAGCLELDTPAEVRRLAAQAAACAGETS